jgi:hypothetical protein
LSTDEAQPRDDVPPAGAAAGTGGGAEPIASSPQGEEQLRAAYEAELSRLTSTDVMAQAVVSLLNLGARRLAPAAGGQPGEPVGEPGFANPERDLEQARDAIDAVRALLEIIERRIPARELAPLRDALSRLQMAYAQSAGPPAPGAGAPAAPGSGTSAGPGASPGVSGSAGSGSPPGGAGSDQEPGAGGDRPAGPGPAESSGRLWVPGR